MSLPQRPEPTSPGHRGPGRHHRLNDVETGSGYHADGQQYSSPPTRRPTLPTGDGPQAGGPGPADPYTPTGTPGPDFGRKRSLIRPERNRIDRDHPNYYYRQHAQQQNMNVLPSTTGNDPIVEDRTEAASHASTDSTDLKSLTRPTQSNPRYSEDEMETVPRRHTSKKLTRAHTKRHSLDEKEKLKRQDDAVRPPSLWNVYCAIVTFWCPGALLKCFGKPAKAQQRAWREKMGLISIIILICAFVGFLTFGFTQAVCGSPVQRLKVNHVGGGYMIIHGRAYDLTKSKHPATVDFPAGRNVLYDLPEKNGGKDASFLFQNVNGQCKGLITPADKSMIPTDSSGGMAWYFPCRVFNQDGSTKPNPNMTDQKYLGYACHTSGAARQAYYDLQVTTDVYFTWDDIKNSSRNLLVYSSSVLDLDLLNWLDNSQVNYPSQFDEFRQDPKLRGIDVTHLFQGSPEKKLAKCLSEIIRVGSIDTETVGCIASKVVLYVSLVFIVSIVLIKFLLALFFGWFLSWRLGATRASDMRKDMKKRRDEIEVWSNDIYRPPPKLKDANAPAGDRSSKRGSFLPTTSRFTSPYAQERPQSRHRPFPTTMGSQSSTARLLAPGQVMYQQVGQNGSKGSLSGMMTESMSGSNLLSPNHGGQPGERFSVYSEIDGPTPAGFIHEAVVPQPPPEYQPFGFPLAHALCLITCYSEGEQGVRTTLDSVATTDYPNSHKLMLIVCDGMIKGHGETKTTPEIILSMMKDHDVHPDAVQGFSYVAVASGAKRHNMAKVYAGFYDYGQDSQIPPEKQQRVPMLVVVKCGTPDEEGGGKAGNRGKRDSQIILMSFLQKIMFDERMTELEFEMFNGIWKITGISPDYYEVVLMVDADTKVFPDSLTHMIAAMVHDPDIMGLCGETTIANKTGSWVSMIQVFEYFISHHLTKAFESVFGGVTCLPGCFCMYRIKTPKGGQNYWVPILANPDVVEHYSENVVDTLHKKNLLLLGEDRYLSTLMLKTFPKRKQIFVPQAVCKTIVPDEFKVLLSQRRRWINSTVHNLMELVLVRDLCGTFCFSMQFVVFIELIGTLVLPAAITFTFYLIIISFVKKPVPIIPLVLLALILGLPAVLIVLTAHRWSYVLWMLIYLLSLPVWNLILPAYAFWKFDDFSWGDTRKVAGETTKKAGIEYEGEFDSSKIVMKRWADFERERRQRLPQSGWAPQPAGSWSHHQGYEGEHQDM
ncbi:chitin synthase [Choiromyces venosus 120613-1]|uniref:chitin synthase n=1 Tax=Choiromyces venosus 120613-1 TaxID=1336337 RepID=A0A3N4IUW8_9PEZI|nr:chitin synthase [Choiromyces venosus 120613-1]